MDPKPRRIFNVLDALILIAAIGVGLAWIRVFTQTEGMTDPYPDGSEIVVGRPIPSPVVAVLIGFWCVDTSSNLVATVTIALVLLRAFPPRPGIRRLTRQPGAVACWAVMVAVAFEMLSKFSDVVHILRFGGDPWFDLWRTTPWNIQGSSESLAVSVAWLLLMGSRRWKPERSWIDRVGIILGVFWLVFAPLKWLIVGVVFPAIWPN